MRSLIIVRRTAGILLCTISASAGAAPPISSELPLAPPRVTEARGSQKLPAMAWDGVNFLVAYTDDRGGTRQISGARFNHARESRDPFSFAITSGPAPKSHPAVASNGSGFLVVWEEARNGTDGIYGTRVSAGGLVLDPGGIELSNAAGAQLRPAVAWDGTNYVVAWQDARTDGASFDLYAARVSPAGAVLDPGGIIVSAEPGDQLDPALVGTGGAVLAAWSDLRGGVSHDISATALLPDGSVTTPGGVLVAASLRDEEEPAIAWNGSNALITWVEHFVGTGRDIVAARVDATAMLVDATPLVVAASADDELSPSVASDGAGFVISFGTNVGYAWAARVDGMGVLLGVNPVDYAWNIKSTAAAFGGASYAVAFEDWVDHIAIEGLAPDGTELGQKVASPGAAANEHPAVAWNGSVYLAAWVETATQHGQRTIYAGRVTADGVVLDPDGIWLDDEVSSNYTSVASNGTHFLIVWRTVAAAKQQIWGARIDTEGNVLDASRVVIASNDAGKNATAVGSNGSGYLVVWEDRRAQQYVNQLYGARVTAGGQVLDPDGFPIATSPNQKYAPSVGWDGVQYVVAWEDETGCTGCRNIRAARVSLDGVVLDPDGVALTTGAALRRNASVAGDGSQTLILWEDNRAGLFDIYGTRLSRGGQPLTPGGFAVSTGASDQLAPALAYDGALFWAVWQDGRRGAELDLSAARIASDGTVLDPSDEAQSPLEVSVEPWSEGPPALSFAGQTQALLAYSRYVPMPHAGAPLLKSRLIGQLSPIGASCTTAAQCASGFCADGVCCQSACGGEVSDCQVCSVAAGGAADGQCTLASAGSVCRAARGSCDPSETCDGAAFTCPTDDYLPDGSACADGGICGSGRCSTEPLRPPKFLSTPATTATCGAPWRYSPVKLEGDGPFAFRVAPAGDAEIPDGVYLNIETGELMWTPTPEQQGAHRFELIAEGDSGITPQVVEVAVDCPGAGLFGVGCGCTSSSGATWLWVFAAALLLSLRRSLSR